jgi:hypothetical protein
MSREPDDRFRALYDAELPWVLRTLRRLGVGQADVEDLVHDVFVVVHRKLGELDAAGAPAADVRVSARLDASSPNPWSWLAVAITGVDGRFELTVHEDGPFSLDADRGGSGATTVGGVRAGARDMVLRLEPSASIEGTLVGFDDRARVGLTRPQTQSWMLAHAEGGAFVARDLAPGRWMITVTDGTRAAASDVEVRAGETTRVTIEGGGLSTVAGTVVSFRDGTPITTGRCSVAPSAGDHAPAFHAMTSSEMSAPIDAQGRFRIDGAPSGAIAVRCIGDASSWPGVTFAEAPAGGRVDVEVKVLVRREPDHRPNGVGLRLAAWLSSSRVAEVRPGGAAHGADVRAGDAILAVDGLAVAALPPPSVLALIGDRAVGQPVSITFARGAETFTRVLTVEPPWD